MAKLSRSKRRRAARTLAAKGFHEHATMLSGTPLITGSRAAARYWRQSAFVAAETIFPPGHQHASPGYLKHLGALIASRYSAG